MKRILSALVMSAVFAALMIIATTSARTVPAAYASTGCSVGTLHGNYGFTDSGFSSAHGSTTFPFDAVGLATFDGAGGVSATFASSFNGSSSTGNAYTGLYTVNPDCTGLVTSTNGGDNFAFVIVSGGADVLGTDISAGTTTNIEFKKQ